LSKRRNSALRKEYQQDARFMNKKQETANQKYYKNNTIDFPTHKQHKSPPQLIPKSLNQERYILSLLDDNTDIVVVHGPAGTGKTYLAMLAAIRAYRSGMCEKIILTRPAVGVDDEKHGFLPGDINQKMEPWTRPLLDVMREYYNTKDIEYMLEEQLLEIAPLAFCRGRNFKNAWIILDEAQNCTPSQLKMIMTRIGQGSKLVITGDIEQADRRTADNGLLDLQQRLTKTNVPGLSICGFDVKDVQRHKIIEHVLNLYG
jgi:phosphate starvation-inducible PhoH-like protein